MKTLHQEQCKNIKNIIERISGTLDIGIKSRKRPIPDLKKIYCNLCKKHTNASLNTIAKSLNQNYDHSSVMAGIKEINNLIDVNQFLLFKLYKKCDIAVEEFIELNQKEKTESYYSLIFTNFLEWQKEEEKLHPNKETSYFINKYNKINNFS